MTTKKEALSPRRRPVTGAANKTRISQVGTVFIPVVSLSQKEVHSNIPDEQPEKNRGQELPEAR
jgi:hypothetical protein